MIWQRGIVIWHHSQAWPTPGSQIHQIIDNKTLSQVTTRSTLKIILIFILLNSSQLVFADIPDDSAYIDGGKSKTAVILAHGKGKYPTWLVVDSLRKGINDRLGYHTLSLQMPTGYDNWRDYTDSFPDAYALIINAIKFLKKEKDIEKIFLIGHSMGSRVSSAFVAENPNQPISGLIVAGCRNNGGYPLSCKENLQNIDIPILDIWGGNNDKDSNAALDRKGLISATFKQVEISGANHKFEGYENELIDAIVFWLKNH